MSEKAKTISLIASRASGIANMEHLNTILLVTEQFAEMSACTSPSIDDAEGLEPDPEETLDEDETETDGLDLGSDDGLGDDDEAPANRRNTRQPEKPVARTTTRRVAPEPEPDDADDADDAKDPDADPDDDDDGVDIDSMSYVELVKFAAEEWGLSKEEVDSFCEGETTKKAKAVVIRSNLVDIQETYDEFAEKGLLALEKLAKKKGLTVGNLSSKATIKIGPKFTKDQKIEVFAQELALAKFFD